MCPHRANRLPFCGSLLHRLGSACEVVDPSSTQLFQTISNVLSIDLHQVLSGSSRNTSSSRVIRNDTLTREHNKEGCESLQSKQRGSADYDLRYAIIGTQGHLTAVTEICLVTSQKDSSWQVTQSRRTVCTGPWRSGSKTSGRTVPSSRY